MTTYTIEIRGAHGVWTPAPGDATGWILTEARRAVAAGLSGHDGTPIAAADVRYIEEHEAAEPEPEEPEPTIVELAELVTGVIDDLRAEGRVEPADMIATFLCDRYDVPESQAEVLEALVHAALARDPLVGDAGVYEPIEGAL